jgi:uncharacterized membrane protein YedE/YeeE
MTNKFLDIFYNSYTCDTLEVHYLLISIPFLIIMISSLYLISFTFIETYQTMSIFDLLLFILFIPLLLWVVIKYAMLTISVIVTFTRRTLMKGGKNE